MNRGQILLVLALMAGLVFQSWRLGQEKEHTQEQAKYTKSLQEGLAQNRIAFRTLLALNNENAEAAARLNADSQKTAGLLSERRRQIEELKRENESLRRWADSLLPDAVVRLRERPAITGGAAYREWLSQNNPLQPASGSTKNQR